MNTREHDDAIACEHPLRCRQNLDGRRRVQARCRCCGALFGRQEFAPLPLRPVPGVVDLQVWRSRRLAAEERTGDRG